MTDSCYSALYLGPEKELHKSAASPDQVSAGGQGEHPEGDKAGNHGESAQRSYQYYV